MADIKQQVGQQIRDARLKAELTQKELGAKLGVSESTVNQYESGKQNLTVDTLTKIATALNIKFTTVLE